MTFSTLPRFARLTFRCLALKLPPLKNPLECFSMKRTNFLRDFLTSKTAFSSFLSSLDKRRLFDKIGDALLFQPIVLMIKRHIRGERLNRGDEPDKHHLGIDTDFLNSACIVVTREDEVPMQL